MGSSALRASFSIPRWSMLKQIPNEAKRSSAMAANRSRSWLQHARSILEKRSIPSNCTTKTWLSDLLPDGALMELSEMEGKQATSLILEGEVVSQSRFNNETQELDIPAGYVAIALPAEDIQAVGGRISAGSKVDVYATGAKTTCLGRDLEVLATSADNDESSSRTKLTWITLAVKPEKAQEFVTASESLAIYFTLPSGKSQEASAQEGEAAKNEQGANTENETEQQNAPEKTDTDEQNTTIELK